jgi:hypothetical protein
LSAVQRRSTQQKVSLAASEAAPRRYSLRKFALKIDIKTGYRFFAGMTNDRRCGVTPRP